MTEPTPVPVPVPVPGQLRREPVTGVAIQFDGRVPSLLLVFAQLKADTDGVTMAIEFGPNGAIRQVAFYGKINLVIKNRDWVIVPADGMPMFVISHEDYLESWEGTDATQ